MLLNISCIASSHIHTYSTLLKPKIFPTLKKEYFADVHVFISHSTHAKVETKDYQNSLQTTIDPESILWKTQRGLKRLWRSPHIRGSSKSPWLAQDPTNQILEGLFQMTYPCTWLLLWELFFLQLTGQNDRGNIPLLSQNQRLCLPVSTGVQGTEQTTLQAMKLLAWYKKQHIDCHAVITILPITSWSCVSSP